MVIIFLSESIVALNAIFDPLSSVSFNVIKLSTLLSVKAVSLIFLTASLKVIVRFEFTATFISVSGGLNTYVGGRLSATVNVSDAALIALLKKSSTVAPIAA